MSGCYHISCHVNMHCSGATYSHFCIEHLAKKLKKNANYPKIPPKTKKNPPLETSKPENMLKMTHVRSKKEVKKNKTALGSERHYSQKE